MFRSIDSDKNKSLICQPILGAMGVSGVYGKLLGSRDGRDRRFLRVLISGASVLRCTRDSSIRLAYGRG